MPDDVTLNAGTGGDVIGADLISGVKYQRVKLIHGADGVNDGDVSNANPLPIKFKSTTGTTSQVADNAAAVTILAANTARLGATIYNDSTAVLYLKYGSGATTSDYTVQVSTNGYHEVPYGYTGLITGIWATDPNTGGAKVTELT